MRGNHFALSRANLDRAGARRPAGSDRRARSAQACRSRADVTLEVGTIRAKEPARAEDSAAIGRPTPPVQVTARRARPRRSSMRIPLLALALVACSLSVRAQGLVQLAFEGE